MRYPFPGLSWAHFLCSWISGLIVVMYFLQRSLIADANFLFICSGIHTPQTTSLIIWFPSRFIFFIPFHFLTGEPGSKSLFGFHGFRSISSWALNLQALSQYLTANTTTPIKRERNNPCSFRGIVVLFHNQQEETTMAGNTSWKDQPDQRTITISCIEAVQEIKMTDKEGKVIAR